MTDWLEVVVDTTVAAADEVAAELIDTVPAASMGTQVRGAEVVFWVAATDAEVALDDTRTTLRGLRDRGVDVDPDRAKIQSAVPETEWRDAWKRYFHVTRLTDRIVVVPSWESFDPGPEDVVIDLDPGQAFGTGAHASTQLVLEELERERSSGRLVETFCDVGCGSGILSIATAKLFPDSRGVAVDIDPLAVDATTDNARANGVGEQLHASATPVEELDGPFSLVVANIQAHVLLALVDAITELVAPGGVLVLSGLLTTQAAGVAQVYADRLGGAVTLTTSKRDPEWTAASIARPESGLV